MKTVVTTPLTARFTSQLAVRTIQNNGFLIWVLSLCLGCASLCSAQAPVLNGPKDPTANSIVQRAQLSMGASRIAKDQTVLLSGTLTLEGDNAVSFPINIKGRGTSQLRCELTTKKGTRVTVFNNGHGAIQQPDGSINTLTDENAVGQRNVYIPSLSLLSEYQLPTTSLDYVGSAAVDGTSADVIGMGVYAGPDASRAKKLSQQTRTLFYLDQSTGHLLRLQQLHYSENDSNSRQTMEIRFSDWRDISGVAVPFRQQTYVEGKLLFDLTLNAVTFGGGLSDSDFTIGK